jgi:hypothetical protein
MVVMLIPKDQFKIHMVNKAIVRRCLLIADSRWKEKKRSRNRLLHTGKSSLKRRGKKWRS